MLEKPTIWSILQSHVPKGQWVPLARIYGIVESHWTMTQEDLATRKAVSGVPAWKVRVRRVLESKIKEGSVRGRRRPA